MEVGKKVEITVFNDLKVVVAVGQYGNYVQLFRKDYWISYSEKAWRFVCNNVELISKSLKSGSEYGLTVTNAKDVRISLYRGQNYVCFRETVSKGEESFEKFINLSPEEWQSLVDVLDEITDVFNWDVIYKSDDNRWHLIKEAGGLTSGDVSYALTPRMTEKNVIQKLYVYLIISEINRYLKRSCIGCSYDAPDQYSHMSSGTGCLQDWEDAVLYNFQMAKGMVCLPASVDKLNKAMGWELESTATFDDGQLRNLTERLNSLQWDVYDESEPVKGQSVLYWRLFRFLEL